MINMLINKGAGSVNSRYITAIKNRNKSIAKNATFYRMYLFLNPYTLVIVQNEDWHERVKTHHLMLEAARPVDLRSYRQRVEDRLEKLARKYKTVCMRKKAFYFRTPVMLTIE
jgi:hypothetical protein